MKKIQSINPFTEEVVEEFDLLSLDDCKSEVENSRNAFYEWKSRSISDREKYANAIKKILLENKRKYAEIVTQEVGKPIKESIAEIEKCAWLSEYFAAKSQQFLKDELIQTEAKKTYVTFEPLGVILGIMPWNFPFWQVFRFAIPAMMAGNVCLVKHASNVPRCALVIEEVFRDSSFPPYVYKNLLVDSNTTMNIIEKEFVDGVSLTGSVNAGSQVGSLSGKHIKKLVLELGGSDPYIILDDADLDKAAEKSVKARMMNIGQSCIAGKRFIVLESVADAFQKKFIKNFKALKFGNPMDDSTDLGPVAKQQFVIELENQLKDAERKGATIILGPKPPQDKGFFFQPAIVTNVDTTMKVVSEEVFGPIAPIIRAKDEEEIIHLANSTEYGLGASIWSKNIKRAEMIAKKIEAGFVVINDQVISDPRLPFGGIKKSGVGRELSYFGIKEFVNIKTIVVKE